MPHFVAPSLLSADFANLEKDVQMLNRSTADWIHLDVMDGLFVPNISFGFPILEAVRARTQKPLDVHLMIEDPARYVSAFSRAGADILTVHVEACRHLHRTIELIRENKMKVGVALNPHTPVSALEEVLPLLDLVLIMSVNPGFGGQKFIGSTLLKLAKLKEMMARTGSEPLVEVDGGINAENALSLVRAGATVLVAGSYVFKAKEPIEAIANLKRG